MREILFRGKRIDNGVWVEGDLIQLHDGRMYIVNNVHGACIDDKGNFINTEEPFVCAVDPATVGQYTGLTDRNGKKIFEGDIVLFEDECPSNYEYHDCTEMRCGAIEYGDNCFYITNRIAVTMEDLIYDGKLDVEVIGNIHDNPEFLKG